MPWHTGAKQDGPVRPRRRPAKTHAPGKADDRGLHLRPRPHPPRPRQAGRVAARGHGPAPGRDGAARAQGPQRARYRSVDDVVLGCVDPVGEAGGDIARAAALVADYGNHVPGVQINRFCASGLDAINFAAAQVMAGQHDMTVGGGVESMSRVGLGASGGAWPVDPAIAIKSYFMPQGVSADLIATKYGFSRDDCDAYAVQSQDPFGQVLGRRAVQGLRRAGARRERHHPARPRRAHAARRPTCSRSGSSRPRSCRWARWAASMRWRSTRIRTSRRSTTSTMPATRRASSTAPPPC